MALVCSAVIENDQERRAIMAWVRSSNPTSYSEIEKTVSMTFDGDPKDPDYSGKYWGIIHVFEQYPDHSIQSN